MTTSPSAATHSERLWVPVGWWVIGIVIGLPVAAALGIYLGWWQVLAFTVAAAVALVGGLWWYGSARVVVGPDGFRAGDYFVEWDYVGQAVALDARATHDRLGPKADAAAALVMRPYVPTSVEVAIVDPDDPHPYWLVSTRRPTAVARAINARAVHATKESA